jgi:hypothetical protein
MATERDLFDKWLDVMAQPGNEGGTTGKRTRIKAPDGTHNTATGKWQITDGTRDRILYNMGNKTQASLNAARERFKTDPAFERQVARQYLVTLDNSLPKDMGEADRVRSWSKGWYTGDVNYPDNAVPHPEKGNKITAGYYADKVNYQMGYTSKPPQAPKTTATTTQSTTASSTTPRTDVSFNTEELSRRANEGVVPPASSFPRKTLEPLPESTKAASTTTTTEASVKPATTTTTAQTPTMAKSTDTKKYNAKAMKPLENVDMLPYLSNIYSAFTRPPATPNPILNTPISLQRMSMDVDRTQVEGDYRDTLRNSDLVDVATSTRAKLAAKAAKFNQLSKVNETERNVNKEIANQEMTMNNAINQANRQALYNKQLQDVERQNAIINQQTANVSNVTDKMIAQQARRDQENLELQKMDILANYDQFGNLRKYMASKGLGEDATGFKTNAMGGRLYTAGRFMKTLKPIKTVK